MSLVNCWQLRLPRCRGSDQLLVFLVHSRSHLCPPFVPVLLTHPFTSHSPCAEHSRCGATLARQLATSRRCTRVPGLEPCGGPLPRCSLRRPSYRPSSASSGCASSPCPTSARALPGCCPAAFLFARVVLTAHGRCGIIMYIAQLIEMTVACPCVEDHGHEPSSECWGAVENAKNCSRKRWAVCCPLKRGRGHGGDCRQPGGWSWNALA